ncbi:apolipo protein O-domain-containing protein [Suillus discolor]|uniref:MICOS complex subunit n=1 Tax=Suillus discolor TaxID=1912936 RepID=A0A9P7JQ81_9AGAM|nr:apolipo protein O-domain-containing protein [Suillus discolor]KAG2099276.1 apolipo protein O-domain-containing protein [Suillus discolor]
MVRREITGYYTGVHSNAQGIIDRWISVEEKVETRIKSFRDPTEPLNPELLYTGIFALMTCVLTRSRGLPTRILLPPAALISAFAYFLPGTASRVGAYGRELEDRYVPRFGEIRRTSIAHSGIAWERVGYSTGMGHTAGMGVTGMAGTGTVSRCGTRGHTVPVSTVYGYVYGCLR